MVLMILIVIIFPLPPYVDILFAQPRRCPAAKQHSSFVYTDHFFAEWGLGDFSYI